MAGSAEKEEEKKPVTDTVKKYDFRTANKFSKEQMRTLSIIYENYGRLMTNNLTGTLRTSVEIELVSVEEVSFKEFNNSLPSPVLLVIFSMRPMYGTLLFEMSPSIAYGMINRLLGGTTALAPTEDSERAFTEIELVILEKIVKQFMTVTANAWEKVAKVNPIIERVETTPMFAQVVSPNEQTAIITLNIKIGDNIEGLVNICVPHLSIEPIARQLNTKALFSSSSPDRVLAPMTENIRSRLMNTKLDVVSHFNGTTASVKEIAGLQVGDVIQLDHKVGEPLSVMIQHLNKFKAVVGVSDKKYALKITDILGEEADPNEQ